MVMGNSMGYVEALDGDRQILTEVMRLLRPGGRVVVDVADAARVKASFSPTAWHEIGEDVVVCRERSLDGDRLRVREMVMSKHKGLLRDHTYGVRLYDGECLERLMVGCGFSRVHIHKDFSPHGKQGDFGFMNHRMLAVGQKPDRY
jgi:D-alanine-D-alanine ligase